MQNTYYNDFDREIKGERQVDYRTPFQQDRDRLVHTGAFRRLQAKTQVFLAGEYDFYRTRLTHSIEVAKIAGSICNYLAARDPLLAEDFQVDGDLVEVVALSHDLGHPPFGHSGEQTLNRLMADHGGFEGNAQTLRLLTETIYAGEGGRRGLSPTRAFVDGVLKYKTRRDRHPDQPHPHNHFVYVDQQSCLDFAFGGSGPPAELAPGKPLDSFRSLECQIMDWADDTAYSLNDVADGIRAGFITIGGIESWARDTAGDGEDARLVENLIDIIRRGNVERRFSNRIADFVAACSLVREDNCLSAVTNRYALRLVIDPAVKAEQKFYKRLAVDLVFRTPAVCQLEHKGGLILERIFRTLEENYLGGGRPRPLLPADHEAQLAALDDGGDNDTGRRLICDYLAGMTDRFAVRIYKRLFDPDFGSIADLV